MGQHTSSRAHTIRLKSEVWDAIELQASLLGMTRNEIVARRLTAAFLRAQEVRKTVQFDQIPATLAGTEIAQAEEIDGD
jgi:hypothetical protein